MESLSRTGSVWTELATRLRPGTPSHMEWKENKYTEWGKRRGCAWPLCPHFWTSKKKWYVLQSSYWLQPLGFNYRPPAPFKLLVLPTQKYTIQYITFYFTLTAKIWEFEKNDFRKSTLNRISFCPPWIPHRGGKSDWTLFCSLLRNTINPVPFPDN